MKVWAIGQWILLGMALWLATVPAWLVMRDRWWHQPFISEQVYFIWNKVKFPAIASLPEYFWIIFACLGVLFVVSFFLRIPGHTFIAGTQQGIEGNHVHDDISPRQKKVAKFLGQVSLIAFPFVAIPMLGTGLPGFEYAAFCGLYLTTWGVGTVSFQKVWMWTRANGEFWLSVILAHIALVGVLVSVYTHDLPLWLTATILVLALANLFRFRMRLSPVFWVVSLSLVLSTLYLNAWWFSVVGDEFAFYGSAAWISGHWNEASHYLFHGTYLYGKHPYLGIALMAAFMKVFGAANFGWRFSNLYLSALSLVFFYGFFRHFLSQRLALWSVTLLGVSHYLFDFGKIGYNNLQGMFVLSLVLWTSAWAVQSKRKLAFVGVGIAQALCLYLFTGAMIAFPLPWLFFAFYDWPKQPSSQALKRWGISLLTFVVLIFPLLWQHAFWEAIFNMTSYGPETIGSLPFGSLSEFLKSAVIQHLLGPIYLTDQTHFVVSSMLDPLSSVFFLLGFLAVVWTLMERSFFRTLLLTFAYMFFALIITSSRINPSATRVFFLLPWLAVITALGLAWLVAWLKRAGLSDKVQRSFVAMIFIGITGLNLWQAYPISYQNSGQYQTIQVYYLKATQYLFTSNREANPRTSLILVSQIDRFINSLKELLEIYRIPYRDDQLTQAYNADELTPETLQSPWTLIMVSRMDEETTAEVVALLEKTDKTPCSIYSITGFWLFDLWVSPGMKDVCQDLYIEPFEGWLH